MPKSFLKPIYSKQRELRNNQAVALWDSRSCPNFYYFPKVASTSKTMRKYGISSYNLHRECWGNAPSYLTKKQVDKLPKYMRRGGEYGHDDVIMRNGYGLDSNSKNLCRRYGIKIHYKIN